MAEDLVTRLKAKADARKASLRSTLVATAPANPVPTAGTTGLATTPVKNTQMNLPAAVPEVLTKVSPEMSQLVEFDTAKFISNMAALHKALESKAPGIANYLRDINRNLNQYQELTHLLNEEQIGLIVTGLLFMSDTEIATTNATKKRGQLDLSDMEQLF